MAWSLLAVYFYGSLILPRNGRRKLKLPCGQIYLFLNAHLPRLDLRFIWSGGGKQASAESNNLRRR